MASKSAKKHIGSGTKYLNVNFDGGCKLRNYTTIHFLGINSSLHKILPVKGMIRRKHDKSNQNDDNNRNEFAGIGFIDKFLSNKKYSKCHNFEFKLHIKP